MPPELRPGPATDAAPTLTRSVGRRPSRRNARGGATPSRPDRGHATRQPTERPRVLPFTAGLLPEQVADGPAHHLVAVGLVGDALEAEAEVDAVLGGGDGSLGEPGGGGCLEVVRVRRAPRRGARRGPAVH